jgi:peptide-methionine (R)-S-oxide reductase
MVTRRQFVTVLGATMLGVPAALWLMDGSGAASITSGMSFPVAHTDAEWRARLTSAQFRVLRGHATERAFSSPLNHEKRHGTFSCAGCGQPLFASETKFESGTGWPSFWEPVEGSVVTTVDRSYFMVRTEVHCSQCGGHLGHVFGDGPPPTGLRYCMNGAALVFTPYA